MKNNITELVFILDKSGSMEGLEKDTIGGFNSMIKKQKKLEGDCYVTTVLFDDTCKKIHDRIPIGEIGYMTEKDYVAGGCTALMDAVGGAIKHIGNIHRYIRDEDVPQNTIFVITTDGMENASRKFDGVTVRGLIDDKKKNNGWEFIFLGANIDAVGTAEGIGIDADFAVEYLADPKGTSCIFESMSSVIEGVRLGCGIGKKWSKSIKDDCNKRKK